MGNSKKPNKPWLRIEPDASVDIPEDEKEVIKEVPANIKWAEVSGINRMDVEIVGKSLLYDDGSFDVIYDFETMSEDAKKFLGFYQQTGPYSIGPHQGVN